MGGCVPAMVSFAPSISNTFQMVNGNDVEPSIANDRNNLINDFSAFPSVVLVLQGFFDLFL